MRPDALAPSSSPNSPSIKLLSQVVCPHCWERSAPEEALWIAEHADLLGDPRLGPDASQRFLASRFTPQGDAIDARGLTCRSLACPKCHLPLPRALFELEPVFLSILGAPSSGKSFFLTAMTWQLRELLPLKFSVAFSDADPASNRTLNACEQSLFFRGSSNRVVPLSDLIEKTALEGDLYNVVNHGEQPVRHPRPFLFTAQPTGAHPNADKPAKASRVICLYDNAGEHFEPGRDTTASPVTRHLAHSRAWFFLFDPTQDPRFQAACRGSSGGPQSRLSRQETILNEAAARVRRLAGMSQQAKFETPIIMIISKFDQWSHLLGASIPDEPYRSAAAGGLSGLDVDAVESVSEDVRRLMLKHCPETVAAAEGFAKRVVYLPASSLGNQPEAVSGSHVAGIRPQNIAPYWATVPLLYTLTRTVPGLIPKLVSRPRRA